MRKSFIKSMRYFKDLKSKHVKCSLVWFKPQNCFDVSFHSEKFIKEQLPFLEFITDKKI